MKLFFVCLFWVINHSSFAQTAEEILDSYFKASSNGGITKWEAIKTLYATGKSYYSQKSFEIQDSTFDYNDLCYKKLYRRWPDDQKEELYDDSLFRNRNSSFFFSKNHTVIMLGFMDPFETTPKEKAMFNFYPLQIKNYRKKSKSISYNGIKVIRGIPEPCYEIEIITPDVNHVLLFNTESYLLNAIYFRDTNTYQVITDYKLFDGYLLPTYVANTKNGVTFSWMMYKAFEFNVKFEEHLFNPRYEEMSSSKALNPREVLKAEEATLNDFISKNFMGKRVFVDMWATWCNPCKWEFKNHDSAYYSLMEKQGISLLYLSIDKDADNKKWEADIAKLGLKGVHTRANKDILQSLKELIFDGGTITIPRYILIDRDGTIISKNFMRPSNPAFKEELVRTLQVK